MDMIVAASSNFSQIFVLVKQTSVNQGVLKVQGWDPTVQDVSIV